MKIETLFKLLLTCNLISSISLSIITPFLPLFIKTRGISEDLIGTIFSTHPIGASVTAFVVGISMNHKNKYKIMSTGLLIQALSAFFFVTLQLVEEKGTTILISTFARFLNGAGSAMFFTPFYAIVPQLFPENVESKVAISAFTNSLGYMIGPVVGSVLYSLGGFGGPFAFFGILAFGMGITIIFLSKQIFSMNQNAQQLNQKSIKLSYFYVIIELEILILFLITFICNVVFTFHSPIIANYYFEQYNVSPEKVGYYLVGASTGYAFGAILTYYFPIRKRFEIYFLFFGLIFSGISQFFFGPDQLTGLDHHIYYNLGAQFTSGFSTLFAYVFIIPYLNKYLNKHFHFGESSYVASTLFNIAASCGELVGPIVSGNLVQQFGFDRASSCMGLSILLIAILSLPIVYKEIFTSSSMETIQIEIGVIKSEQFKNDDLV